MSNGAKIIYGKLSNTTGVTGIIGVVPDDRIFPMVLPQQVTLPALTYYQVGQMGFHASGKDPNIASVDMQVSSWSTSYTEVQGLARQVKAALQDYTGSTWVDTQRVFFESEIEISSVDPESKGVTFQIAQNYTVWYST